MPPKNWLIRLRRQNRNPKKGHIGEAGSPYVDGEGPHTSHGSRGKCDGGDLPPPPPHGIDKQEMCAVPQAPRSINPKPPHYLRNLFGNNGHSRGAHGPAMLRHGWPGHPRRTEPWLSGCSSPSLCWILSPLEEKRFAREILGKYQYRALAGVSKLRKKKLIPYLPPPKISPLWLTQVHLTPPKERRMNFAPL